MPYYSPVDLSNAHEFVAAVTDKGVCHVMNGDALRSTYRASERVDLLAESLDPRQEASPGKIFGTGRMYRKSFWLNVADK